MAQVRNISTDTLAVPHLGLIVKPGEVIDTVDDELVWSPALWLDVDAPPPVRQPEAPEAPPADQPA